MNRSTIFLTAICCSLGVFAKSACAESLDWPTWRGPQQNRTSTETDLVDRWDPKGGEGSNLLWKNTELGGRSTPIVMAGRLYTIARDQAGTPTEGSKVVCVDAATGEKIWQHRMNVYLTDVPDTRVGWSSVTGDPATGRVYVLSVSGYFCCLEGKTGEVVWERSLHEEFGLLSTYGGRTHSPLIFEDTVLISAVVIGWGDAPEWGFLAKPAHRFMSFDKATGELRWLKGTRISPYDTTYSTPTLTTLGGQAAMVFGSGDGSIWALQPRTGEPIWHYPFSRRGVNISPLVVGDTVYASHSEENIVGNTMGSVVAIDGRMQGDLTDKEKWRVYEVMAGKASPVMVDGKLWVIDDRSKLWIFDPETGKALVRRKAFGKDKVMRSTPLVADGKVYIPTNNGHWYVLKPTDTAKGFKVVDKMRLPGHACDGSPVVSHGRIYFPTSAALYCLGNKESIASNAGVSEPLEDTISRGRISHLSTPNPQLAPYDSLVTPGEKVAFQVRTFDERGNQIDFSPAKQKVSWSIEGPGAISEEGVYTTPADVGHTAVLVKYSVEYESGVPGVPMIDKNGNAVPGESTTSVATARVRIVPPLPWRFDFNTDEKVPLTWVGGRVRYVTREVDGERIAVKRTVLPTPRNPNNKLGTRSRMWMGPTDLANYTVQADFALQKSDATGKMSDLGLINSRYTMTARSSNKKLRVYSWSPHDYRTFAEVDFDPVPGKWYTMKLEVVPRGESASVRGKLWVRGEAEPEAWTVEMIDPTPNLSGSPGLYGNAQEAEIYIDNLSVVRHE